MHTVRDLRYAVRSLLRSPGFTIVSLLTIALGIGANTAIFTILNALVLRPLPYAEPDRLVMVWQDLRARGGPADEWATPGNLVDWRQEGGLFQSVAGVAGWRPTLTGEAEPESVPGEQVTSEYFRVLGRPVALGRDFTSDDDVPNARRVTIISDGLWKRRFGASRSAIGQTVMLSGDAHEIVGVLAPGFRPIVSPLAEIWRPLRLPTTNPSRGAIFLRAVARLPEQTTLAAAQARAASLAQRLEIAYPDFNEKTTFWLQPLHERVTGPIKPGLLALLGGVACVLLIACANIANLLMARGSARGRELAVRAALGAGKWRLVSQLLTESLLLAFAGGALGTLFAVWGVDALVAIAPSNAPRLDEIGVDGRVFIFTAVVTVVTGILFGLGPALQQARTDVADPLKDAARGGTAAAGRALRRGLIAAEVALALVLLTGGVLLIQTFVRLQSADLGFETGNVLIGSVNPPQRPYDSAERLRTFYDALLTRVAAIPGVERAALGSVVPLSAGDSDVNFTIEGRPAPRSQSEAPVTWYRGVSAGYLETMGMPLGRGRHFVEGEPQPSVIVNETLVRRYFPSDDPLGRRIRLGSDGPWFTVIGVVADARGRGARAETVVETFVPYWHLPERGMTVVLRGDNAASLAGPLRQAVASIDHNVAVIGLSTMSQVLDDSIGQPRFLAMLAGAFAALALVLAGVGIYGVMSYAVSHRTVEIGLRMALGATAREIFQLVIGDGLRVAALGVAIGIGGAVAVARSLSSLLFGVAPGDPLVLAGVSAALVLVAAAASFVPAWRATRLDPMMALRSE